MIILSGGTGTPKLLQGVACVHDHDDLTVVVNTAEDSWAGGNLVTPDIDTVLYLLSGKLDTDKWWGIKDDTFTTHRALEAMGFDEGMMIGDNDRATHIMRTQMLRNGHTLTSSIEKLADLFEIDIRVLPMSDDPISTIICTPEGEMHFQEFWIREKGLPDILDVRIEGIDKAKISPAVQKALKTDDQILIGPSNPVTSIGPILSIPGMVDILKEKIVVAISPIIAGKPVSGPAEKLMAARGIEVSSTGVADVYRNIMDAFVVDIRDEISGRNFETDRYSVYREDTLMSSGKKSENLAHAVLSIFEDLSKS
ncbi:LPPG domain protein containing protein [Methanosalsum zhilinae DSM 4017]|uniref:2-phospho-L-lactate transferase n=1 Tax=Methanosalsum zhilinae (strain DSM 4017 / NBRC 107636 / OCM 62 / WeN5) TaxID=679901 RepID=F7XQS1_METZD|nr:2-phospho-L-lactate transferase [Methanosalsum zhilinae]AEH61675.1 LPPG domain protein containing protein [Methanosalsum zhilinae DSM 4017]